MGKSRKAVYKNRWVCCIWISYAFVGYLGLGLIVQHYSIARAPVSSNQAHALKGVGGQTMEISSSFTRLSHLTPRVGVCSTRWVARQQYTFAILLSQVTTTLHPTKRGKNTDKSCFPWTPSSPCKMRDTPCIDLYVVPFLKDTVIIVPCLHILPMS